MHASNPAREHSESEPLAQSFGRPTPDGTLWCEGVSLEEIARRFGTPTYVYSKAMIESRFDAYDRAFGETPHLVCYAVKANAALGILETLASRGAGFDTVSGGEILKAVAAGADPKKIVFSGVGKSRPEIALALFAGIRCFNIESIEELERIEAEAARLGRRAPIAVRVNPDVDPHVEERIATGLGTSKFGVDRDDVLPLYRRARELPHVEIVGISCHIGSQIQSTEPYLCMVEVLADIVRQLHAEGIVLKHIDFGGGAGVAYRESEKTLPPSELVSALVEKAREVLPGEALTYLIEPGRSIVAEAGVLLMRVEFLKHARAGARYAIVDASMSELLRPALYGAWHEIERVGSAAAQTELPISIAGPVCESTDILGRNRIIATFDNDLLVARTAGAYGMSMASNYNSRPLPFEVLVSGDRVEPLQKRRQTPLDLIEAQRSLLDKSAAGEARERAAALYEETAAFVRFMKESLERT